MTRPVRARNAPASGAASPEAGPPHLNEGHESGADGRALVAPRIRARGRNIVKLRGLPKAHYY